MSLFRCGAPFARAPENGAGAARTARGVRIDIHCHMLSARAEAMAAPYFSPAKEPSLAFASEETRTINRRQRIEAAEQLTSVPRRLADMDAMGIDVQAISPAPTQYYYWLDPELGRATAAVINDELAATAAAHPGRFVALGTIPLQHTGLAIAELERCMRDLGMRGVEISSHVNGAELAHDGRERFFARAAELGAVLFLHPLGFTDGRRLSRHYFGNVIGNPIEAAIAIGHLIFDGVLDRLPGLKICVAHGGGYLPMYAGRMDHAHAARADCRGCRDRPSSYLGRLHFDTVTFDPEQIGYLVHRYGHERVLLGTDYPYDMGESDPLGLIERVPGLTAEQRAAIAGGNAAALLGLQPAPS